jgi:hypothetical protein
MATTLIPIAEYSVSNYDPDRDYVDGNLPGCITTAEIARRFISQSTFR